MHGAETFIRPQHDFFARKNGAVVPVANKPDF
jgi:hypothetical protein